MKNNKKHLLKEYNNLPNKLLIEVFKHFKDEMNTGSNSIDQYYNYKNRLDCIQIILDHRGISFKGYEND